MRGEGWEAGGVRCLSPQNSPRPTSSEYTVLHLITAVWKPGCGGVEYTVRVCWCEGVAM